MCIHYRQLLYILTVLLCVATVVLPDAAQEAGSAVARVPEPATRIDLSAIGFHEPSRMDRTAEYQPSLSLDFVDAEHVLLTFNRKQLIKRQPECTPDHEDRLMLSVRLRREIALGAGGQPGKHAAVEATSMRLDVQDQMSNHLGTVDVPLPVPPDPNAPKIARNKLPEIEPD